jgi:hypothetical protein
MIFKKIRLDTAGKTVKSLKESFARVVSFLEKGGTLNLKVLEELQQGLSAVIAGDGQIREVLEQAAKGSDFFHMNLCHPDAEVLNLPWGTALDPVSGRMLSEVPQVFISKNVSTKEKGPALPGPGGGPLKILVMISSPKDVSLGGRLHYEEEERQVLRAFEPLFQAGEVQVDFTEDGSLPALRRKVELNDYHILHFSGHGDFDEDKGAGVLLLEDPVSLKSRPAGALDFAEALLKPGHRIPLVVLSSCRTAKAGFEKGAAGITGTLLQKGIPAVVAMGLSIQDRYATFFAGHFYGELAIKKTTAEAFAGACRYTRELEAKDTRHAQQSLVPLQWLIPQLYLHGPLRLVDWDKPFVRLKPGGTVLLFENTTMEKSGQTSEQFVGRREDLAVILPKFFAKKPIMLKGQGGIGKTTLARKLVQRLQASLPTLVPFIYNEEGKEFSLPAVLGQLKRFCAVKGKKDWLDLLEHSGDNIVSHITFLFEKISEAFPLVLLFDNVESFLDEASGAFAVEHEATLRIIRGAVQSPQIYTLVTGRYPLQELAGQLETFDLNDIDLNDFIRKCYNLGLTGLSQGQMEFLYQTLGGNFRMLEFFYRAFTREGSPGMTFDGLGTFQRQVREYTGTALQEMAENLIFHRLWQKSGEQVQALAKELAGFELPVMDVVFRMVGYDLVPRESLGRLLDLTLIQVYLDRETGLVYYFMPALVKRLLERRGWLEKMPEQFHEQAGRYHYYMYKEVRRGSTSELDAAFWQFYRAGNRERISELGEDLAGFYYGHAFYAEALRVCRGVEELWGEQLSWWYCNRIGLIGLSTGSYDLALPYFLRGMNILERAVHPGDEDLKNKGTTLNNISQIYDARGDYDTALRYLEQSLKIRKQIGDIAGEATTCFNMATIFAETGKIEKAIPLVERTVQIDQITQNPDLESDMRYLTELRGMVSG